MDIQPHDIVKAHTVKKHGLYVFVPVVEVTEEMMTVTMPDNSQKTLFKTLAFERKRPQSQHTQSPFELDQWRTKLYTRPPGKAKYSYRPSYF